jgi:hypothetical protein
MVLVNFRAAKLVVLLSDCKRQSSNSRGNILPPPLALDFFRVTSASRGVLSSKHCGPVWRQAQLTDAIGLSGAAVVENCYIAHLACCLMQCNLATEPSGPGSKLDPPDHTQPRPAPPWTQRVPGGVKLRPLASLIAQLVRTQQQAPGIEVTATGIHIIDATSTIQPAH